jgi:O-antigen/teichoic acid export membrane protein
MFVFIKNIATQSLTYFDKIVVSAFLGPSAVSFYSLPGNVTVKTIGVVGSMTEIFFPLTSQLNSSGDREKVAGIYRRVMRNILLISAAATCAIILFGRKILLYWLGPDFAAISSGILYVLAVTYFFLSWYVPVTNFLLGLGAVRLLAFASVCMFVLNMLFLFLLLPHFNLMGAAWAYLLAVLPVPFIVVYAEHRYLGLKGSWRFYLNLGLKLLAVSAIYYLLTRFVLRPLAVNVYSLIVVGPGSVLIYLLIYKILGFMPEEDWLTFKNYLSSLYNRFIYAKFK